MKLKKSTEIKLFLLTILCVVLTSSLFNSESLYQSNDKKTSKIGGNYVSPLTSEDPFEFIQNFEASTYYISPESSLGENDGVFFSFIANKRGNYTIQIENFPNFITNTENEEPYTSFDNPTGTDLWYIGYSEVEPYTYGQANLKMLISEDKGKTWTNQLIKRIYANYTTYLPGNNYICGMAIAVYPKTGFMIMVTWLNQTQLVFLKSKDNGTTWDDPKPILNSTDIGAQNLGVSNPSLDVAIIKNGTILIVSEAKDSKFTDLVFVQSDNNGTTWYAPRNITCSKKPISTVTGKIPKIQTNQNSEDFWLMWYYYDSNFLRNCSYRWAQFNKTHQLFTDTQYQNITTFNKNRNFRTYDFYYDQKNNIFRLITLERDFPNTIIINWTCESFKYKSWKKNILGNFEGLGELGNPNIYVDYIYYQNNQIFFPFNYLGNPDVFQYKIYTDNDYWIKKDFFSKNELTQIYWNGKKGNMNPIENTLVKVTFRDNYTEQSGEKRLYIIIDNENPTITEFQQKWQYFNPKSINLTLTEIPWELLSSESCKASLEIFSQKSSTSVWSQILQNDWDDYDPKIFYSNKGILYVVYQSLESGRKIVYLIKSYDMGVTWIYPVKIYEFYGVNKRIVGAAWNDVVFIYMCDTYSRSTQYLYRSFDQGDNFQDPINISKSITFPKQSEPISKIVISNNGTMFMTFKNASWQYYVLRSNDLGINWTITITFPGNKTYTPSASILNPNLAYDSINNLVHFVRPLDKTQGSMRIINISISTFDFINNKWSTLKSIGIFNASLPSLGTFFIITRDNFTSNPKVRFIYFYNFKFPDMVLNFKEIISTDLGANWVGPFNFNFDQISDLYSSLDEIFYSSIQSDGDDGEIFFKREGKLVRVINVDLSSKIKKTITFDGIDDFGGYIDEGNYTYNIILKDNAGNIDITTSWFYVDYDAPKIDNYSINTNSPMPYYDVKVSVRVTDSINFTAYLYYKRNNGVWESIVMNNAGNNYYTATILGAITSNSIEYYIMAIDLAGNQYILDNSGSNFFYDVPTFIWESEGLFKETKSYSSSKEYSFEITILNDLEYVSEVIFRYSYDEGDSWDDLELEQSSPEFEGTLEDIPGDLRELYYKIIVIDIFGNEYELADTEKIDFYPEVPEVEFNVLSVLLMIIVSSIVGFLVAYGYIKLKHTSHEFISKQIFHKELKAKANKLNKKTMDKHTIEHEKNINEEEEKIKEFEKIQRSNIAMPFTMAYIGILCGTVLMFSLGIFISYVTPAMGILVLAGSLLLGVYGYMILMSRDITINIYLEKIFKRNLFLEMFQMGLMLINIMMILVVGYSMDWFRYYLVESTFDIGALSIPRLYLSVLAVFFSSLVLVIITTYVQLRKTVYNILKQRTQKASENLLFFLKDQNSSRMITHMGYKTIVFLVTVLLGVVTTTNLLTYNTGIALIIILVPFVIAGFSALIVTRIIENKKKKNEKETESIEMLFIDSKKFCTKCGEPAYLSDKHCGSCGTQLIFSDMLGKYVLRCSECNALVNEKAKYCPECGKQIKTAVSIKKTKIE